MPEDLENDVTNLFEDDETPTFQENSNESPESGTGDMLGQDEIDAMMSTLPTGETTQSKERQEIIKNITPERIAAEWDRLTPEYQKFIVNESDEAFSRGMDLLKKKFEKEFGERVERKIQISTILRWLIHQKDSLSSEINTQNIERKAA